ncbi:MAG: sigma-70 family RNA polymerase sigma factor, partial [Deltaproteobacteria bacterium]|nr:sigma-70 family RNA polymerase sigma factor [Nannocystaceae bacterium]
MIAGTTIEPGLAPNGWSRATLRGFRAGEPDALREVYRAHAEDIGKLLRFGFSFESSGRAHRFVGYDSAFELQDALHETFRRAFEPRAREGYDGLRPYGPYLRTIARNVVLRAFRAQRQLFPLAEEGHGPGDGAVVLADNEPSVEHAALRRELDVIVREFLDQLPADDRRLLTVRFLDGLSQRDAAD